MLNLQLLFCIDMFKHFERGMLRNLSLNLFYFTDWFYVT
jgi:hypothetical protein